MIQIYSNEAIIFDLDDLLYKEFDFMRSGFWTIANLVDVYNPKKLFNLMMVQYFEGKAVLDWLYYDYLKSASEFTIISLITIYRTHKPDISINIDVMEILTQLNHNGNEMGLITDGRSITQRNKIEALKLSRWFDEFVISEELGFEKPSEKPFLYFMDKFNSKNFIYLADNYNKDFIAPNNLGWRTIALRDNGLNIHSMKENLSLQSYPLQTINNFSELVINSGFNDGIMK